MVAFRCQGQGIALRSCRRHELLSESRLESAGRLLTHSAEHGTGQYGIGITVQ